MRVRGAVWLVLVLWSAMAWAAVADAAEKDARPLVVGTKEAPPFAMKSEDGAWLGISIELWEHVAGSRGLTFEYREYDLEGLLAAVKDGTVDVAVAALTVTPEREEAFDFSHPFHTTGLGIAVPASQGAGPLGTLAGLLSGRVLHAIAIVVLLLLAVGTLTWFLERRRNPGQFGGGPAAGIGSGFWWSAVTMTTVGYGDKAPVTLGGRLVALVWMFASLTLLAAFTGVIASALTVGQLEGRVNGPEDLPRVRVTTIEESTSAQFLRARFIGHRTVKTAKTALEALAAGSTDAVVYDAPLLRHLVNTEFADTVRVLPKTFQRQDYAIALPSGSPLREPINVSLERVVLEPAWDDTLFRYLGTR